MINRPYVSLCSMLIAVFALPLTAKAIEKPNIDLYKGTLNGHLFSDLTIDGVADIFGRPSTVMWLPQEKIDLLIYSDLGLMIAFSKNISKCVIISVSISGKNLDKSMRMSELSNITLSKYKGVISENINDNWRLKDIIERFQGKKLLLHESYRWVDVHFPSKVIVYFYYEVTPHSLHQFPIS